MSDHQSPPRVWAKKSIRAALVSETSGRCAYCDAQLLHVAYGDIEHIRPRDMYPNLVVDWDNLTLACGLCNGAKSNLFDEDLPFINPYVDPIEHHMGFYGPYVFGLPHSDRGLYTVVTLDLNSAERVESRLSRMRSLMSLVRSWAKATGSLRDAFEAEIQEFIATSEYQSTMTSYLRAIGFPQP